jgi:hypothetical protein
MKIDRQMLEQFRKDFQEAVKGLESKYGMVISLGRITYGYDEFTGKLEVKSGADKDDVMKREFEKNCSYVGLDPEDYGQVFTQQGKDYKIIGLDLAKRKYPVIIQEVLTGKTVRCTVDYVKRAGQ